MPATACRHMRFLLAVAIAATAATSKAEARHWRFHWHYHHGSYQGTDEGLGGDTGAFGNYEADDFGRGIKRMIGACAGQAVELKTMPFDLVSRIVQPNDAQRDALEHVRSRRMKLPLRFQLPARRTFLRSLAASLISSATR
jgi:hypothetical protein